MHMRELHLATWSILADGGDLGEGLLGTGGDHLAAELLAAQLALAVALLVRRWWGSVVRRRGWGTGRGGWIHTLRGAKDRGGGCTCGGSTCCGCG